MKLFPNHEPYCPTNWFCRSCIKLFYIPCYRWKFWFSSLEFLPADIITISLAPLLFPYLGHSYIVLYHTYRIYTTNPQLFAPRVLQRSTNNSILSTWSTLPKVLNKFLTLMVSISFPQMLGQSGLPQNIVEFLKHFSSFNHFFQCKQGKRKAKYIYKRQSCLLVRHVTYRPVQTITPGVWLKKILVVNLEGAWRQSNFGFDFDFELSQLWSISQRVTT
jgi:hypothetical protein